LEEQKLLLHIKAAKLRLIRGAAAAVVVVVNVIIILPRVFKGPLDQGLKVHLQKALQLGGGGLGGRKGLEHAQRLGRVLVGQPVDDVRQDALFCCCYVQHSGLKKDRGVCVRLIEHGGYALVLRFIFCVVPQKHDDTQATKRSAAQPSALKTTHTPTPTPITPSKAAAYIHPLVDVGRHGARLPD
jgi:hypothetical protein